MHTLAFGGLAEQVSSCLRETTHLSHQALSNCCVKPFVSHSVPRGLSLSNISTRCHSGGQQIRFQPGAEPSGAAWCQKEGATSPGLGSLGEERKKPLSFAFENSQDR